MKIKYDTSDGRILDYTTNDSIDLTCSQNENTVIIETHNGIIERCINYRYLNGEVELIPKYSFGITSTAEDTDNDGLLDILADGSSSCTLTIRKKTANGNNTTGSDEVWISCTRGKLSAIHGNLSSGQLQVTLTSIEETVLSEIIVTAKNQHITDGKIQIQFRP